MKWCFSALSALLILSAPLLSAQEILLKDGSSIRMEDVLSKDQFGVMVAVRTDPATGGKLRRFIPFAGMNPGALLYFPFCDMKAAERIESAVRDRIQLLYKKFKEERAGFKDIRDFTKKLTIHTGVSEYRVWFDAAESTPCGLIGWLYSDSPESSFYGLIHLYGLLGNADTVWVGTIYPEEKTFRKGDFLYPEFTVIKPPKKNDSILSREIPGTVPEEKTVRSGGSRNTPAKQWKNPLVPGKGKIHAVPPSGK